MVDDDIEEQSSAHYVGLVGQLAKLIDARGAFVEHNQGRVDRGKIKSGVRTAGPAEARVHQWVWDEPVGGAEFDNPRYQDVRQFLVGHAMCPMEE